MREKRQNQEDRRFGMRVAHYIYQQTLAKPVEYHRVKRLVPQSNGDICRDYLQRRSEDREAGLFHFICLYTDE
jgi:hypothetical protein